MGGLGDYRRGDKAGALFELTPSANFRVGSNSYFRLMEQLNAVDFTVEQRPGHHPEGDA